MKRTARASAVPRFPTKATRQQVHDVCRFEQVLREIRAEQIITFAGIGGASYDPAIEQFVDACYASGLVQQLDWATMRDEVQNFLRNPDLLEDAALDDCIRLLTCVIRADRFSTGYLGACIRDGHVPRILARLRVVVKSET
jgi:hypothetical protein